MQTFEYTNYNDVIAKELIKLVWKIQIEINSFFVQPSEIEGMGKKNKALGLRG